jgi:hypothetical protein
MQSLEKGWTLVDGSADGKATWLIVSFRRRDTATFG